MAANADERGQPRQAINHEQENLYRNERVDHACENALGKDRMLLDQLREIVQSTRDRQRQEQEAEYQADIALEIMVST